MSSGHPGASPASPAPANRKPAGKSHPKAPATARMPAVSVALVNRKHPAKPFTPKAPGHIAGVVAAPNVHPKKKK